MEPEHYGERLVATGLERSGGRLGMVNCCADPLLWPWLRVATPHCHRGGSLIETRGAGWSHSNLLIDFRRKSLFRQSSGCGYRKPQIEAVLMRLHPTRDPLWCNGNRH